MGADGTGSYRGQRVRRTDMTDAASSANSTASNEPARVLVADDDRAIRESLERVLSLEGYEVATVADGAAALESARSVPADLHGARPDDAVRRRADGVPGPAQRGRPHPDPDADRPDRDLGPGGRPRRRRRRLPAQALRPRRAAGPGPGPAAADPARAHGPRPRCSRWPTCASTRRPAGAGGPTSELELSKTEFDLLELLVRNAGIVLDRVHASTSASGATTSGRTRRTWPSTSATSAARSTTART